MKTVKFGIIGTGGEFSAVSIVRSLGKYKYPCYTFLQKGNNVCEYSKYHSGQDILSNDINKMVDELPSVLRRRRITHIICIDEEIKFAIMRRAPEFSEFKFACPPIQSYETMLRKHSSSEFVEKIGIPVPKTIRPKSVDEIKDIDTSRTLVVKGDRGVGAMNVRYAKSTQELIKYYKEISEIEADNEFVSSPPIIQQYVGGPTYYTHGIAQKGKTLAIIPHLKIREWPLTGGTTARAVTIDSPKLESYTEKLIEELNWHGEVSLEWKYDSINDEFYFIEMNPRFAGSLGLVERAGVNLPLILYHIMENKKINYKIEYKVGTNYSFFFFNDFKCFLNRPYGLMNFFAELMNPNINGDITLDDPGVIFGHWQRPIREIHSFIQK